MNYFSDDELKCQHCGGLVFDDDFKSILNSIRHDCGFPLPISSGYRCPNHPIEVAKDTVGAHASGKAVDIAVSGQKAYRLLQVAIQHNIPRIGINQKGNSRFIHLDHDLDLPYPRIWSY